MTTRKVLLVCGALSSVLYVGIDQLIAVRHGDFHSFTAQTISELSARGAPTKQLVDPLIVLYDVLLLAFGGGVWMAAIGKRGLRIVAALLIAFAAIGLPGPWLFPMHLRGPRTLSADVPHIIATGVMALLILAMVVFGAFTLGRRFRLYSLATLVVFVVFGTLVCIEAPGIISGTPTPWIGLTERASVGAFLLWVAVLAIALLRGQEGAATIQPP